MAPFGVTHDYDAHGHRIAVRDKETEDAYWQLSDVDDAGRTTGELFGNGVTTTRGYDDDKQTLQSMTTMLGGSTIQQLSYAWDERLNLESRTDARQLTNTTERFRYDALNRLTCAYFGLAENPSAPCAASYGYSANGNLTSKSDVGVLTYTDPKHPHAVTGIPGQTFSYDASGNQVIRPGGVSITYTPFDLPQTIQKAGKTVRFAYDGDQQRIRKTTTTSETIYFEDLYERITAGGNVEHRYSVHSPERVIAIVTRGGNAPGIAYLHVDHLGSTEAVTNDKGVQVEKRSYDAFAQRRNVNWGMPPPASFTSTTRQGFTGHDEEDEFGLVNMRGRLLDPKTGRFTTTDPVISNVFNGQTLNAFSYVRNNPLTLVDPSGFTEEEAWRIWRAEETPGQLGLTITFEKLTPPGSAQPAADVGAQAPTNDTGTTGTGGHGLLGQTSNAEPTASRPDFWDGVGDGGIDALQLIPALIPTPTLSMVQSIQANVAAVEAYQNGDLIDAINTANPLMGVATLGFAIDDEDWYTVGRASVGVGVTILAAIVGKKLAAGTGGKATRGAGVKTEPPQLARGKLAHKQEPVLPGEKSEVPTPSGKRMDRYDENNGHIREIKPNNPRAMKEGATQVERYRQEMEKSTGRRHTAEVSPYNPKDYE